MWAVRVRPAAISAEIPAGSEAEGAVVRFVLPCSRCRMRLPCVGVLHHLALGTRDVALLSRFYTDVLELREVTRHLHADGTLRSVWLDLGGPILMIEPTTESPRRVVGVGAGPFLIALAVSEAERRACEARLECNGCAIESRSEFTSYARDPDGNRIAISAYPLAGLTQR